MHLISRIFEESHLQSSFRAPRQTSTAKDVQSGCQTGFTRKCLICLGESQLVSHEKGHVRLIVKHPSHRWESLGLAAGNGIDFGNRTDAVTFELAIKGGPADAQHAPGEGLVPLG